MTAAVGEVPPRPAQLAALELELGLARRADIYLVLDPASRKLEVRARGMTLDSVSLSGVELIVHGPLLGRTTPPSPALPSVWRIVEGPGDTDREYIAPTELRPYNPDGYEDLRTTANSASPTPTPVSEPPASYRATLDAGWDIWIVTELPPQGLFARVRAAVRDGWERVRGRGAHLRPAVTLAMSREDAQRLHHLMRRGMAILALSAP